MNLVTSFIWFWTRFNYRNNISNLSLKVENPIREEDHKWVMQISKRIYLEKNQKV
jgi:hypothetical protein